MSACSPSSGRGSPSAGRNTPTNKPCCTCASNCGTRSIEGATSERTCERTIQHSDRGRECDELCEERLVTSETVLRPSAEQQYAAELEALAAVDDRPKPPMWKLSPQAV